MAGMGADACTIVVKQGYLWKRGEYIKTWRRRYFILFQDGSFLGFRTKPEDGYGEPQNNFTVKDCQLLMQEKPRSNSFIIRGLQWNAIVERLFSADDAVEREQWAQDIGSVAGSLKDAGKMDVELSINSRKGKWSLEDFEYLKVLGKGSYGKVILCRRKDKSNFYAMKIVRKELVIEKKEVVHVLTEKRVLQAASHPFITQLMCSFQTAAHLFFVMEYINGGELLFHLTREKPFSEERTRFYGAEIISAMGYLHKNNIIYRDMKLENVLLDKDGHVKITDFGLCKENMGHGDCTHTFCGTPEYIAPEVLEDNNYTRAVDWWGTGVVMYEMMCGHLPFFNSDCSDLFVLIMMAEIMFPRWLSEDAKSVLRGFLAKNPKKRLGGGEDDILEIMVHPFFFSIDWSKLYEKKIPPPFLPNVTSDTDTRYFEKVFTEESVALSPYVSGGELETENMTSFDTFSFYGSKMSLASSKMDH